VLVIDARKTHDRKVERPSRSTRDHHFERASPMRRTTARRARAERE